MGGVGESGQRYVDPVPADSPDVAEPMKVVKALKAVWLSLKPNRVLMDSPQSVE